MLFVYSECLGCCVPFGINEECNIFSPDTKKDKNICVYLNRSLRTQLDKKLNVTSAASTPNFKWSAHMCQLHVEENCIVFILTRKNM